ncbi:MAG: hypothetical protein KKF48_01215 [Nanoarchaeota archaeon]|nr:hypothetical protein [Nanoarchaeota archaeon]MBU1027642.1 hypothetical protein [Nanoarchaeota archaeon]
MSKEIFQKQKEFVLFKVDKSSKGHYDKKIITLCEKINKKDNYYTTSSCSGRVVIIKDKKKKEKGVFVFVSHDLVGVKELKKVLEDKDENLKFKQEPCILHVACRDLENALELLKKAQLAGWKRSGVISSKGKFVCELLSTEKLELPFAQKGKLLFDSTYLEILIKKANENLKKTWLKIEMLGKLI